MSGSVAPRRRLLPDILSVLVVYALIALGTYIFARQVLGSAPDLPTIEEHMPVIVLAILPLTLGLIFALRLRGLSLDIKARRYGARLRARLAALFLAIVVAASLPQGLFLLRLAERAQASASTSEVRRALAAGRDLELAWYEEELGRVGRLAAALAADARASGLDPTLQNNATVLLGLLHPREPSIEAIELFVRDRSLDFAGEADARLSEKPQQPPPGSPGHLLSTSASGVTSSIRYAAPWPPAGPEGVAVLTMRLPESLEGNADLLSKAARTAELLGPFSRQWRGLLIALYCFFVLPLLLLASLLSLAAADVVAEPLASLEDATHRVAAGDFGVRLIVKPGDETGQLVASFNKMLAEIERYRSDELLRGKIDAWQDIAQRLAHELKNPLTPIRLAAERVLRRWNTDPARAGEIVENSMLAIVKEVEAMDALLSDFRAFASLPKPSRAWTDLRSLVEEAVALYAASYPDVHFVRENLIEGLSLRIDRGAMKRAIGNILSNAVDAMEGKGTVEIRADLVKAADSRYCRLRIRDTGRGIPGSVGNKVFVPYFTTKPAGTGLGLSIVERIVADHGGIVRFESAEGAGTTFFVDLPLDR